MISDTDQHDAAGKPNEWSVPPTGRPGLTEPTSLGSWIAGLAGLALFCGIIGYGYNQGIQVAAGKNPELETRAREYIAATLNDPQSAQFRNVNVHRTCVQGEVNAKNAFGGYVGFANFYFDSRTGLGAIAPEHLIDAAPGSQIKLAQLSESADYTTGNANCIVGNETRKP